MNGIERRRLRTQLGPRFKLFALTGQDTDHTKMMADAASFDAFMPKPARRGAAGAVASASTPEGTSSRAAGALVIGRTRCPMLPGLVSPLIDRHPRRAGVQVDLAAKDVHGNLQAPRPAAGPGLPERWRCAPLLASCPCKPLRSGPGCCQPAATAV